MRERERRRRRRKRLDDTSLAADGYENVQPGTETLPVGPVGYIQYSRPH